MTDITHDAPFASRYRRPRRRAETLTGLLRHIRAAYADYRALRRTIRHLDDLSDDQLRDIGLRRSGSGGARMRPLGGDPISIYPRHCGLGSPLGR